MQIELKKKNMLFPKSDLELGRVIGQGGEGWGKSNILFSGHSIITGESGLVYRGYVKRGAFTELVAIKTGKGMYTSRAIILLHLYIYTTVLAFSSAGSE